jgi:hypothetical protein
MCKTDHYFQQWQQAERRLRNAESRLRARANLDGADNVDLGPLRAAVAESLQFALREGLRGNGVSIHVRSRGVPLETPP